MNMAFSLQLVFFVIFIFMNDMDERMLQECPESFKPIFYKRFVDDTCVTFKRPDDAEQFHRYINNFHS